MQWNLEKTTEDGEADADDAEGGSLDDLTDRETRVDLAKAKEYLPSKNNSKQKACRNSGWETYYTFLFP